MIQDRSYAVGENALTLTLSLWEREPAFNCVTPIKKPSSQASAWPSTAWIWLSGPRARSGSWHDPASISSLVLELRSLEPLSVVLESTGGLELPLAKTDALDAQVIAHFAGAVRPAIRPLPDSGTQELHSRNLANFADGKITVSRMSPKLKERSS